MSAGNCPSTHFTGFHNGSFLPTYMAYIVSRFVFHRKLVGLPRSPKDEPLWGNRSIQCFSLCDFFLILYFINFLSLLVGFVKGLFWRELAFAIIGVERPFRLTASIRMSSWRIGSGHHSETVFQVKTLHSLHRRCWFSTSPVMHSCFRSSLFWWIELLLVFVTRYFLH